ncbi:hypothetical protein DL96DRAFT_251959 [Flagelloscypha sp. PMI_526]|nr:hypothetical protein DL96DRAFT_251959 [Flagelloscypha sp. PMI_526]
MRSIPGRIYYHNIKYRVYNDYTCYFWDNQLCGGDALAVTAMSSTTYPLDLTTHKSGQWNDKIVGFSCILPNGPKVSSESDSTRIFELSAPMNYTVGGLLRAMSGDIRECLKMDVPIWDKISMISNDVTCNFFRSSDCTGTPEHFGPGEDGNSLPGAHYQADWHSFRCVRDPIDTGITLSGSGPIVIPGFAAADSKSDTKVAAVNSGSLVSSAASDSCNCPSESNNETSWHTITTTLLSANLLILLVILGFTVTGYLQRRKQDRAYLPVFERDRDAGGFIGVPEFKD